MNNKELMSRGLSDEHADIVLEMIKDSFVPLKPNSSYAD